MARAPSAADGKQQDSDVKPDERSVCGIVMPIAPMGEQYPEEHWRRVRKILQRAIDRAGMRAQLVWENAEVDVIQAAILQNIYENDVVICDVSNLNPNVMLETGLRLSTKRPTIIVTDRVVKPPFDISTIGYIDYQKDLEYNAIEDFIDRLASKIVSVRDAAASNNYHSFVEQFKFETVTPATVTVSAEDHIREQIDRLTNIVMRMDRRQSAPLRFNEARVRANTDAAASKTPTRIRVQADVDQAYAKKIEDELDDLIGFGFSTVEKISDKKYLFSIDRDTSMPFEESRKIVADIVERYELEFALS